ncbi:MAG: DNA polymerase/3'-5' exonuclease PolX [Patescibacteria group bacterium]|jgi:DNA polymerase (family 10)
MTKAQTLAKILFEFSYFHEMHGVAFKPRAYQLASESVTARGDEVEDAWRKGGIKALKELPGIGQNIAEKADELFRTGKIKEYEQMKKQFPVDIWGLSRIEGLGPKHMLDLYKHLKVKNINDLKKALKAHKIKDIPRWGEKSEIKLLNQLNLMEASGGRLLLGYVLPVADEMVRQLSKVKGVTRCTYAGSIRRRQETIGDIDLIATSKNAKSVMDAFVSLPMVESVHEKGKTRSSVRLKIGIDADLRVVPDEVFGATLQYFTGDKRHNVLLREFALSKGYTLNEYGLYKLAKKKATPTTPSPSSGRRGIGLVACKTEEEIYEKLGMETPAPEIRIGEDEIEAALKHKLPNLLPYGSVRGDLQMHSTWSDGTLSIEEMAQAAIKLGRSYIAMTDHSKSMAFINGLDEKRLKQQGKEIDKLNKNFKGFRILKGIECDIHKDGSLDISAAARKELDFVGISVHSHFHLSREEQTKRIIKAMEQPNVNCFFHPTCRLIGKREGIDFDMRAVIAAAKKNNVALEINSFPERSDLSDRWVRAVVKAGAKLMINTDAHTAEHLEFIVLGEAIARRGWATKKDVLNTKTTKEFMAWLA